jgi:hypothetical protein
VSNNNTNVTKEQNRRRNFNLKEKEVQNHVGSFNLARIESANCLGNLSQRLSIELMNIDEKIYKLNKKVIQNMEQSFQNAKNTIFRVMKKVFEETEQSFRLCIKQHSSMLLSELT